MVKFSALIITLFCGNIYQQKLSSIQRYTTDPYSCRYRLPNHNDLQKLLISKRLG